MTSDQLYGEATALQSDGATPFGVFGERPAMLVAGVPQGLHEADACDDGCFFWPTTNRNGGVLVCPGSGRPCPSVPVTGKVRSSLDVVCYPDPSASQDTAARLAVYGNRVVLHHPCCERLFRPPRPA